LIIKGYKQQKSENAPRGKEVPVWVGNLLDNTIIDINALEELEKGMSYKDKSLRPKDISEKTLARLSIMSDAEKTSSLKVLGDLVESLVKLVNEKDAGLAQSLENFDLKKNCDTTDVEVAIGNAKEVIRLVSEVINLKDNSEIAAKLNDIQAAAEALRDPILGKANPVKIPVDFEIPQDGQFKYEFQIRQINQKECFVARNEILADALSKEVALKNDVKLLGHQLANMMKIVPDYFGFGRKLNQADHNRFKEIYEKMKMGNFHITSSHANNVKDVVGEAKEALRLIEKGLGGYIPPMLQPNWDEIRELIDQVNNFVLEKKAVGKLILEPNGSIEKFLSFLANKKNIGQNIVNLIEKALSFETFEESLNSSDKNKLNNIQKELSDNIENLSGEGLKDIYEDVVVLLQKGGFGNPEEKQEISKTMKLIENDISKAVGWSASEMPKQVVARVYKNALKNKLKTLEISLNILVTKAADYGFKQTFNEEAWDRDFNLINDFMKNGFPAKSFKDKATGEDLLSVIKDHLGKAGLTTKNDVDWIINDPILDKLYKDAEKALSEFQKTFQN